MLNVPYRGGGEALTSVISGETSVYFAPVAIALPMVREGRLRPLAVSTPKRLPMLPEYPTVAEVGYPGYVSGNFFGLVVPVKTPHEAARKLGYRGKGVIHPSQIEMVNRIVMPTARELDYYRRVIEAFDAAVARGSAATTVDGKLVDYAMVKMAKRVLAWSKSLTH